MASYQLSLALGNLAPIPIGLLCIAHEDSAATMILVRTQVLAACELTFDPTIGRIS